MAICTKCNGEMGQTEPACPHCGYDFPEPDQSLFSRVMNLVWTCVFCIALVVAFHLWWPDFYRDITFKPYGNFLNQVPPDFSSSGQWLNSEVPLTLSALRGHVVWLEFSFLR